MIKKEINRFLGKEALYKLIEDVDSLNNEIKKNNTDINNLFLTTENYKNTIFDQLKVINDKVHVIQKNSEINQEYLSNEYVALYNKNKINKTRVLVCGFYGAQNVGDELMLESTLGLLDKKIFDVTILLSNNYDIDASEYAPYKILHYPKSSSDTSSIAENFDVMIWGGGAMLDDVGYEFRGQYSTISYILMSIAKAMIKHKKKILVYGVSSNESISNKKFIKDLNYIVDNSVVFSLRDTNSLRSLSKAGVNTKNVKIVNDLSLITLEKIQGSNSSIKTQESCVGINLILKESDIGESIKIIDNIVNYFKEPIKILFIPFYNYQNNDLECFNIISKKLEDKKIDFTIAEQPNNMKDLLNIYDKCSYIFAMRYHAILIAAMAQKKVVMIDYQSKHRHYVNKNDYIKKYVPNLLTIDYDSLLDKNTLKNINIITPVIDKEFYKKSSQITKDVVQKSLKEITRKV